MSTTAVELQEYGTAAAVPATEWDEFLTPRDFYLSSRMLHVSEATAAVPMRYLLLRRDGRLVAALATALADASAPWVLGRPDTMLASAAESGTPGAREALAALPSADVLLPSLVCGGRHMGRTRVLTAADATEHEVEALVARAEELAAAQDARSVAFPFADESDTMLAAILERRGYSSWVSGRYSELPLAEPGFGAYLTRLSARRRRRVLAERRTLAAAGVEVRVGPLDPAHFARFGELETQLLDKYGIRWTPERTVRALEELRSTLGEDALAAVATGGGRIRGFGVLLRFRDQWYARHTGFDYQWQGRLPLYFEVLYYGVVEAAAEAGVTGVHYGLGSEEAKRSRGCVAATQRSFVRWRPAGGAAPTGDEVRAAGGAAPAGGGAPA